MCSNACLRFGFTNLTESEVRGRAVLEVGSRIVQRRELSLRHMIEAFEPSSFVGADIESGPGVDVLCDAGELRQRFGDESFDVVVSTEMLEHVRDWRTVVSNLKHVVRPNGVLLVTTRSYGFPYHAWPSDFWRYETGDMEVIFSDFNLRVVEPDPDFPGVFVKATKPEDFPERDLSEYRLFSVVKRRRTVAIRPRDERLFRVAYAPVRWVRARAPRSLKLAVKRTPLSREHRALAKATERAGSSGR